jgi:hypothetical protein
MLGENDSGNLSQAVRANSAQRWQHHLFTAAWRRLPVSALHCCQ